MIRFHIRLLLFPLILTGCLVKDLDTRGLSQASDDVDYVRQGFFTVNQELYYSTGKDSYCGFRNWEHANKFRDRIDLVSPLIRTNHHPEKMTLVKYCTNDMIE